MKKTFLLFVLVFTIAVFSGCTQSVENVSNVFPSKDIMVNVPFGAGGSTDLLARILAESAQKELGVSVVVNNITGGSGVVGTTEVANANADGYTLEFSASGPFVTQPHMLDSLTYTLDDFMGIVGIMSDTSCIAVHKDSKYETIQDLMEERGEVLVGNTGKGTLHHLLEVAFINNTNIKATSVPFQGGAALVTALMGKQIDVAFDTPAEIIPYVETGEMRILAVATAERLPSLPDVPALKEVGIDIDLALEFFLIGPAEIPNEVASVLKSAFEKAAQDPKVSDFVKTIGSQLNIRSGVDLMDKLKKDYDVFGDLMKEAGI